MDKVILHPSTDDSIGILMPCDCGLTIEEIARKDVPAGVPFLIVNRIDLPENTLYASAWQVDFSEPHGYGIGQEAWFAEQAQTTIEE